MARATFFLLLTSTSLFCFTAANEVTLQFVMSDTQVPEDRGPCDVGLEMRGRLTDDVTVRVRAFTIAQYQNLTGNPFAFNDVPPAETTDFDNNYDEMFTFQQDGGLFQEKTVEAPIFNDDINELDEEFLLFFNVVNGNTPIITGADRNPTRCRIMNDDPIKVNFERASYTVPEGSDLSDIVFIAKDGLTTEVDIEVNITATPQSQLDIDFITPNGKSDFAITFLANQSRIGIPILVPNNNVAEGSRDFRLQFSAFGADLLIKEVTVADITIKDTTPPTPTPSTSQAPSPSSSQTTSSSSFSPSPLPSSSPPPPNPDATVVPATTNSVQLTNINQVTTNIPSQVTTSLAPQVTSSEPIATNAPIVTNVPPECDEKEDKDIDLAIGLTFLITFLLTALCALIIICFVVIVDRKRRVYRHQQIH